CREASFNSMRVPQYRHCHASQAREVLRGMALAHPAVILAEAHVENPMALVFDAPMVADEAVKRDRVRCLAADVIGHLDAGFPVLPALTDCYDDRMQILPGLPVTHPVDVREDPHGAQLSPAMSFVLLGEHVVVEGGQVAIHEPVEHLLEVFKQVRM